MGCCNSTRIETQNSKINDKKKIDLQSLSESNIQYDDEQKNEYLYYVDWNYDNTDNQNKQLDSSKNIKEKDETAEEKLIRILSGNTEARQKINDNTSNDDNIESVKNLKSNLFNLNNKANSYSNNLKNIKFLSDVNNEKNKKSLHFINKYYKSNVKNKKFLNMIKNQSQSTLNTNNSRNNNNKNLAHKYNTLSASPKNFNNTKKIKEKPPFEIKNDYKNDFKLIDIKINSSFFLKEYLMPLWVKKDTTLKFRTQGKWCIDKAHNYTSSNGIPSTHSYGFNYMSLIGRVGDGPPFLIKEESSFTADRDGPLYLKINFPKKFKIDPDGIITVSVLDAEYMSIEEINKKIGWEENNKKKNLKQSDLTKLENELVNNVNNLRMNPILFYEKYIRDKRDIIWTKKFLEKKNLNEKIKPFSINVNCSNLIQKTLDYFGIDNIKKQISKLKTSKFIENMERELKITLIEEIGVESVPCCKVTKKENTIDICAQFLLDQKFREYLFKKEYNSIAVKILSNFYNDNNLAIMILLTDDENASKVNL